MNESSNIKLILEEVEKDLQNTVDKGKEIFKNVEDSVTKNVINPLTDKSNQTKVRLAMVPGGNLFHVDPKQFLDLTKPGVLNPDGKTLSAEGIRQLLEKASKGEKLDPNKKEEPQPDKKKEPEPAKKEDFVNNYVEFHSKDMSSINPELETELIKLAKAAQEYFDDKKIKVHIYSSGRAEDERGNHASGNAVDFLLKGLDSKKTYAFTIASIHNKKIKEGGVGYYATDGDYNKDTMKASDVPHYDINRGTRKWFWFNCVDRAKDGINCPKTWKEDDKNSRHIQTTVVSAESIVKNNSLELPNDVYSLIKKYASESKSSEEKPDGSKKSTQNKMVQLIKEKFAAAGFPEILTKAALVNSYIESTWNPNASGDGDCSVGLFQLNSCGGRGKGMSAEDRKNPEINIQKVIDDIKTNRSTGNILEKSQTETDVEKLVYHFCYHVESPNNREERCKVYVRRTNEILTRAGY